MKSRLFLALAIAGFYLVASNPSIAHHAFAWADNEHPITLTGTVTEFVFVNPHSQVYFDVKDKDGTVSNWMIEMGPPVALRRAGWNSATVKAGDQVTVTGGAAKDGRKLINITGKFLLNGQEVSTRSNDR